MDGNVIISAYFRLFLFRDSPATVDVEACNGGILTSSVVVSRSCLRLPPRLKKQRVIHLDLLLSIEAFPHGVAVARSKSRDVLTQYVVSTVGKDAGGTKALKRCKPRCFPFRRLVTLAGVHLRLSIFYSLTFARSLRIVSCQLALYMSCK
jgi:hypothetical protein